MFTTLVSRKTIFRKTVRKLSRATDAFKQEHRRNCHWLRLKHIIGQLTITQLFIFVHIYSHPQTECFLESHIFSVARHFKLGSKSAWLYVNRIFYSRASVILNISEGNFFMYKFIYIYTIDYLWAQFMRRDLHYIYIYIVTLWTIAVGVYKSIYMYVYMHVYKHISKQRSWCGYVVQWISFQPFFVQAFKIAQDSWKFTMLFLYILWDD